MRGDNGRRRDGKNVEQKNPDNMQNVISPMMMPNMYPQGAVYSMIPFYNAQCFYLCITSIFSK